MIHITIYQDIQRKCVGFLADGHAGYADAGQDIVCAAASVLMINTINAIERYADDQTDLQADEESGRMEYRIQGDPSYEAELLLNAMILGLQDMTDDNSYSEYIYVDFEEVQQS